MPSDLYVKNKHEHHEHHGTRSQRIFTLPTLLITLTDKCEAKISRTIHSMKDTGPRFGGYWQCPSSSILWANLERDLKKYHRRPYPQ
jgi:hypothetical protein